MKAKRVIKLNTNLKQFGLNPTEWVILPKTPGIFKIQNKKDAELSLLGHGKITFDGIQWQQLHWAF